MTPTPRPPTAAAVLLAVMIAAPAAARAAGFASAEFGGEHGNVVATNPTALYYNPAGIAFSEGSGVMADGVLALRRGTWDHAAAPTDVPDPPGAEGANTGRARFSNVFGAPALGATTRVRGLAIGAGFFVPFGGQIRWDGNDRFANDPRFPLAAGGVQRWAITEGALSYLYFTAGAAYRLGRLAIGVTGNVVRSSVSQTQAKNPTGLGDPDTANEGRDTLDVSGTEASFGVGAMLEAIPDRLWLAISYQAQPGLGAMKLRGQLLLTFQGTSAAFPVTLTQALPDIVRFGARLRATRALELRLFGDVARWSRFGTQCISLEDRPCAVSPSGADATPDATTVENLRRLWRDTFAARAGASFWPRPALELTAGLGFETAAVPDATLDPALPDADNVRASLGARVQIARGLFVAAAFASRWYFARDSTGQSLLADADPPTRRADGGGRYTLWLGVLDLSVEKRF